jgi:hypothetical protein
MSSDVRLKATQMTGRPITWAQLNLEASEDLRGLMRRNRWAAELVLALIEKMEPGGGGVVICSRETMRELLDCSMPTIDRALKTIITEGWAQRIKIGGTPALAINSRVAWVGARGALPHAVFSATVIASRSEQDAIALNPPPIRYIPVMRRGELPLMEGAGLIPPSQPDLDGMPPVTAYQAESTDPETGEITLVEPPSQQRLPTEG